MVMNRNGEIVIEDETGRERERYGLIYGAKLLVEDGEQGEARASCSAEWDPFSMPILTEVGGIVKYGDIIEGVTMSEQLDEVTGLSRKVDHRVEGRRHAPAHLAQGRARARP